MQRPRILLAISLFMITLNVKASVLFSAENTDVDFIVAESFAFQLAIFASSSDLDNGVNPEVVNFTTAIPALPGSNGLKAGSVSLANGTPFVVGFSSDGGLNWQHDMGFSGGTTGVLLFDISSLALPETQAGVILVDVQAIPVPASVWLFGTGLLGLVTVARNRF